MKRQRGTGNVFQKDYKDRHGVKQTASTWSFRYYDCATGKKRTQSGFATKGAAADAARDKYADQAHGRLPSERAEKATFSDLAQLIRDDYTLNERNLVRLERSIKHLEDWFGSNRAVPDVDEERIVKYTADRRRKGAKPATVNRELAALKRMFNLGLKQRIVQRRPYIGMLLENNVRTGWLSDEQIAAVLAKLPAEVRPVVEVAAVTGWRVTSEVLTRQWRHVDFEGGWLRLDAGEGKTHEARQFPLDPALRPLLVDLRAQTIILEQATGRIVPWVFHREGHPIRTFRRSWLTACRAAGVPGRRPHDLRRSAVIRMERSGLGRATAMKLVGHKTESVYRRYRIVDETDLKAGAAAAAPAWTKTDVPAKEQA